MSTFTERWRELNWDDIALRINSKTAADVEHALHARQLTREDLMARSIFRTCAPTTVPTVVFP